METGMGRRKRRGGGGADARVIMGRACRQPYYFFSALVNGNFTSSVFKRYTMVQGFMVALNIGKRLGLLLCRPLRVRAGVCVRVEVQGYG